MSEKETDVQQALRRVNAVEDFMKQLLSRQLALSALMGSLVGRLSPEVLPRLLEDYEAACDRLAGQLEPRFQEAKFWYEWSAILEDQIKHHQQAPRPGAGTPPPT